MKYNGLYESSTRSILMNIYFRGIDDDELPKKALI